MLVAETGVDRVAGGKDNDILLDGALLLVSEPMTPEDEAFGLFWLPTDLRNLGDRFFGDWLEWTGQAAADDGDAYKDTFSGGGGNDTFYVARGQTPDTVNCGAGTDKVFADPQDKVASDCEEVIRG